MVDREPWRGHARVVGVGLVVAWAVVPLLTVFWAVPAMRELPLASGVADLVTYPALLMAALLIYVYTRVSPGPGGRHLAAVMVFLTSQGIAYAVLRMALPEGTRDRPGWLILIDVLVAAILVGLLALGDRRRLLDDPLVIGLGLGVAISAIRLVLVTSVDPLISLQLQTPWMSVLVLVLYALAAVLLVRRVSLPRPAAVRLGAVVVLLGLGHTLTYPVPPVDARSLVAVAADLVATVLFCTTAWSLLQDAMREAARSELLEEQLEVAEQAARRDRTVMHQIASVAAGIGSGSHLLASGVIGDPDARDRIVRMLAAESARLQRLFAGGHADAVPQEIDVDETLAPVVAAHSARGRTIDWRPSGRRALAAADRVAEVIGILLDNCAEHSGTSIARLEVSDRPDGTVAITVSDRGYGIAEDVLARGFAWGARGRGSRGQGIGLHHAHRVAAALNGSLTVAGARGRGTSVTLTLPAADPIAMSGESAGA